MPHFVDGWTVAIPYQLFSCSPDYAGPLNLDGATCVSIQAFGTGDVAVPIAGLVTLSGATCGMVSFSPATCDLSQAHAQYKIRFRIVDAAGKVSFCPQEEPEIWTVRRM